MERKHDIWVMGRKENGVREIVNKNP